MGTAVFELTNQAMALPSDEKAILAQRLWDNLKDFANPKIEQAWLFKANKRWHEIEDGIVTSVKHQPQRG